MLEIIAIAVGGALGSVLRHFVGRAALTWLGDGLYGTLTVNVIGSFAMGVFVAWFALRGNPSQEMRAFLIVGLLGGFTTLSAFSLDFAKLVERDQLGGAIGYALASVCLSLAAIFLGMQIVRAIFQAE